MAETKKRYRLFKALNTKKYPNHWAVYLLVRGWNKWEVNQCIGFIEM